MATATRRPSGESAGDEISPVHSGSIGVAMPLRLTHTSSELNPGPVPYSSAPDRDTANCVDAEASIATPSASGDAGRVTATRRTSNGAASSVPLAVAYTI